MSELSLENPLTMGPQFRELLGKDAGKISLVFNLIAYELESARKKFGPFNSTHEAYGVMKEEFDEMWDDIKRNNTTNAGKEAQQVAAMAVSFIVDCCI